MKPPVGTAGITAAAMESAEKHASLSSLPAFFLAASQRHSDKIFHLFLGFGLFGVFLVSAVDSSFVPLPVPGISDIMIVLFAAQKSNWILLILAATAGSALGGYLSYQVGHAGGMPFLEKHVPARIFKNVCEWMEGHAVLAVTLPALLPPPMPLSPFVLAAGALKMSKKKFLVTFILSRGTRHAFAAWLGAYYGRHVLHLWNRFSARWATTILVVLWTTILVSCAIAIWKIYKTSRSVGSRPADLVKRPDTTA
jgi:membrane protein YqaA with SNARE-associated domain